MFFMMVIYFVVFLLGIQSSDGLSSPIVPFTTYNHSVELQANVSDLWWTVDEINQKILFELHIKTTGWIALGISPAGGMADADIGVGWVDQSGNVYFQDRYAYDHVTPVIDTTTTNWFALQGREVNGWTAIQFTRALDTCDSMDVAITTGTNHLIFAYGLVDPSLCPPISDISYHETRRGLYTLSLRSYSDPPLASKFAQLDYFEFRLNNYTVPANDTTYFCKVFKIPSNYSTKRHAVSHRMLIDSANRDLVHHLLLYECDSTLQLNDSDLPSGICDNIQKQLLLCLSNIATGWAVGGDDIVEFPPEAGYPFGGNFSVKYYLVQMHYNNANLTPNRMDSSGIRFYLGDTLRQYDVGCLTFGTDVSINTLAIPPQMNSFLVDSYCPVGASSNFPASGITVLTAFPHTHLQGKTVWTKLIRNKTAVGYLYNAESYDFNFQFENRLSQRIQLYPGDEFATRCIYNTMNKNVTTFGGERTKDEMCLHMFTYYPRINNLYLCVSVLNLASWRNFLKLNYTLNATILQTLINNMNWTSDLGAQWQNFYSNASRTTVYGRSSNLSYTVLAKIPDYIDIKLANCSIQGSQYNSTNSLLQCNLARREKISVFFLFVSYLIGRIIEI